jgi:hypothetical protein
MTSKTSITKRLRKTHPIGTHDFIVWSPSTLDCFCSFYKNLVSLFFCFLSLLILEGCGARYMIGDETFSSSSEALQRQSVILSHTLDAITQTNNPVHGNALFIFPSDAVIQRDYIRLRVGQEQIDFLMTASKNSMQFIGEAIRKRGLFDSVSIARHNGNPESYPVGNYDYVVFRDIDGWFIRGRNNPRGLPITVDMSKYIDASRVSVFLDTLSQQAQGLRSK